MTDDEILTTIADAAVQSLEGYAYGFQDGAWIVGVDKRHIDQFGGPSPVFVRSPCGQHEVHFYRLSDDFEPPSNWRIITKSDQLFPGNN